MGLNLYKQASDLEENNPEEALEIYKKLEHENKEVDIDIFTLGILCPPIAFIIAFFFVQSIEIHKVLATVLIWCGIGFAPPYLLFVTREIRVRKLKRDPQEDDVILKIFSGAFGIFICAFAEIIQLILTIIIAAFFEGVILTILSFIYHIMFGAPFVSLQYLPIYIQLPTFVFCFIIVFIFMASDVPITHLSSIKWIMIGLKLKFKKILVFTLTLSLMLILGGGSIGIFYDNIIYGIIISVWAGTVIGVAFGWIERDYLLGNLYRIAKARCLIRTGHHIEAHYLLSEIEVDLDFPHSNKIINLVWAMRLTIENAPRKDIMGYINEADSSVVDNKYEGIFSDNIQKTRQFASLGYDIDLEEKSPYKNVFGWLMCVSAIILISVFAFYVFAPEECVDGTIDGECSSLKPKYCDKGVLVDNCSKCGCPPGTLCNPGKGCCFPSSACFPSNAQLQLVRGQYLGVGRVLNTGYAYEFDPSEYDPDNPTGYNTGQWIDVEVIEGKIGCRDPGTIIRGVWSYGGDTGIVGKPKVGDLVGYYETQYCNVWEKIENKSVREK